MIMTMMMVLFRVRSRMRKGVEGKPWLRSGFVQDGPSFFFPTSTTFFVITSDIFPIFKETELQVCLVIQCPSLPDSDLCLKFAVLCTMNDKCERLRKAYGEACSGSHCQRLVCLEQLRTFFEKAAEPYAQGLLLCPCAPTDLGCGERRRNTIAPSCALPSVATNCLELRRLCLSDSLCRYGVRVSRNRAAPLLSASFLCGAV